MSRKVLVILILIFCYSTHLFAEKVSEVLKRAEESYSKIHNYSCLFHKTELVGGTYYFGKNVKVKFKKPQNYYMKWTDGEDMGQEVIYSETKYGKKMQAHAGGFFSFFNVSIDPKGSLAMRKTNHPIYQLDIGYLLTLFRKNYNLHKKLKVGTISFEKAETLKGVETIRFKAEFPKGKGFYAKKIIVNFDKKHIFP